jgi:hypothetical protein
MTDILRMRVTWSGSQVVGPGVTTLFAAASPATGWGAAAVALFNSFKYALPSGITFTIPDVVDIVDEAQNRLTGQYNSGTGGTVNTSGGAVDYKPGTGFRMRWATTGVVGGRKVTGTTFICPVISTEIPNGVVLGTTRTTVAAAMAAYIAVSTFTPIVYSPPVENVPDPKGRNRPGASSEIVSGSVAPAMTWLRSRRT